MCVCVGVCVCVCVCACACVVIQSTNLWAQRLFCPLQRIPQLINYNCILCVTVSLKSQALSVRETHFFDIFTFRRVLTVFFLKPLSDVKCKEPVCLFEKSARNQTCWFCHLRLSLYFLYYNLCHGTYKKPEQPADRTEVQSVVKFTCTKINWSLSDFRNYNIIQVLM